MIPTSPLPTFTRPSACLAALLLALAASCASRELVERIAPPAVRWVGIDNRPLAVGSQIVVSFELADDGGATAYSVESSDAAVVSVADQGNQRLLLQVLSPGSTTLTLDVDGTSASQQIQAELPTGVTFSDPSHLITGISPQLPPSFALSVGGQETVQGVVVGQNSTPLNSRGLTQGSGKGAIVATPLEPERYTLAALDTSGSGAFVAGLSGSTATDFTFQIQLVVSAASVELDPAPDPSQTGSWFVLARALTAPPQLEIFGIDDWQFVCVPASACTVTPLSASAVRLSIPPGTIAGSVTLTVTSAKQKLMQAISLP